MANAKLHIICGNCGCNDSFFYEIEEKGQDFGTHFEPSVIIVCKNCSTLHYLETTIPKKE